MPTFEDRERGFETKFKLDQELQFKVNARLNKLIGLWAADKLGLKGAEAEAYAKTVVAADFEGPGDSDVIKKVTSDFGAKKLPIGRRKVKKEMERLLAVAKTQIEGEARKK